ncbi:MAG TPA: MBL fold metallo-hydrolase [Gaiellales bacterium]|jgi:L-ascorbate metabolism protein UlaG (beta-lactamase superfamily)|nr:MBL fold metallo-hydrolase [Gaiellales bacterium]
MQIRWYGQSAFLIRGAQSVLIDPFGMDAATLAARGLRFDYPAIEGVEPDLLLVTHEHGDHNAVGSVSGSPAVLRSTAGTLESPLGQVVAVASEHDDVAGTQRGPNTIFRFALDGLVLAHFGDFGQAALRPEQQAAIGEVDVLFLPVGDGPTVGGERAAGIVRALQPRLVVPMHYRTEAVNFLDPPDAFLEALGARTERLTESEFTVEELLGTRAEPVVVLPAAPGN